MRRFIFVFLMAAVTGCGEQAYPVGYEAPDAGNPDAGCEFIGEDGAQFAPSTTSWWQPSCWPPETP